MVLASTALITGALAGCGNTDSWVEAHASDGWPAQYGNAANSSYSGVAGAEALHLKWSRSVKGDLGAAVALGSGHYLAANAQTPGGCSLIGVKWTASIEHDVRAAIESAIESRIDGRTSGKPARMA